MVDELAVEQSGTGGSPAGSEDDRSELLGSGDLETVILRQVKDDPFASISEIKQQIRGSTAYEDAGWWQIFAVLRRRGLLGRRARFRFARGRR